VIHIESVRGGTCTQTTLVLSPSGFSSYRITASKRRYITENTLVWSHTSSDQAASIFFIIDPTELLSTMRGRMPKAGSSTTSPKYTMLTQFMISRNAFELSTATSNHAMHLTTARLVFTLRAATSSNLLPRAALGRGR